MAKDGTYRGNKPGNYTGAGRKAKPLADRIAEGKTDLAVVSFPEPADMEGVQMPPPKEYMLATQKDGGRMSAEEIYKETWDWLKERGCERLVKAQLLEQYSMSVSRWIQCEQAISQYGFLSKHPTTGAPIASPFVAMSQTYMKQVTQAWFQIYQIVRENCAGDYSGPNPQDDVMERLLRSRGH